MLAGRLNLAKGSSGAKLWEKRNPEAAQALCEVAARRAQQSPTLRTILSLACLTAEEVIKQLRAQGFADDVLPSRSSMAEVLQRDAYRLRPVLKAKPQARRQNGRPLRQYPETCARWPKRSADALEHLRQGYGE